MIAARGLWFDETVARFRAMLWLCMMYRGQALGLEGTGMQFHMIVTAAMAS
jgi:hypothetical protein